jgi:hypothetical protein
MGHGVEFGRFARRSGTRFAKSLLSFISERSFGEVAECSWEKCVWVVLRRLRKEGERRALVFIHTPLRTNGKKECSLECSGGS